MEEIVSLNDKDILELEKIRVEIISSQALDEDFDEEFKMNNVGKKFTKISPVMGAGFSIPRLGNEVWPQLNTMYVIYCSKKEANTIAQIVIKLRKLYPTEGIAMFLSKANELFSY